MKKTSGWLLAGILAFMAAVVPSAGLAADVYVTVTYYGLSPDPVNIQSGDVVYWQDGDDLGPYAITGGWGTFFTPGGIQFVAPGSYSYSAESTFGGGSWYGTVNVSAPSPILLTPPGFADGNIVFSATNLIAGNTNVLLCSSNLVDWVPIQTNIADSTSMNFTNSASAAVAFYRVMQVD